MSVSSFSTFHNTGVVKCLPPLPEDVFCLFLVNSSRILYAQLYPTCAITDISPFFGRCGRIALCGELIGSVMNSRSSNSSAVISAYWPARGHDISSTDYGKRMRVGVIQYFCKHQVTMHTDGEVKDCEHELWKQQHPHEDHYGFSAAVCVNVFETPSVCNLPVQRIHSICAHSTVGVAIQGIHENLFIAVPIPMRFCL